MHGLGQRRPLPVCTTMSTQPQQAGQLQTPGLPQEEELVSQSQDGEGNFTVYYLIPFKS